MSSSDRVCQFYLRGRCQRVNCEFRHDADRLRASSGQQQPSGPPRSTSGPASSSSSSTPVCRFFQAGNCKYRNGGCRFRHDRPSSASGFAAPVTPGARKPSRGASRRDSKDDSDDEIVNRRADGDDSDDDESVASGFTEVQQQRPAALSAAPVPVVVSEVKKPSAVVAEKAKEGGEKEKAKAKNSNLEIEDFVQEPENEEAKSSSEEKVESVQETSLGTTVEEQESVVDPLLVTSKATNKKKGIRRDSKGFQKFDDYFSESETEASEEKQESTAEDSIESVQEDTLDETPKPVRTPARRKRTPVGATSRRNKEKEASNNEKKSNKKKKNVTQKSTDDDLVVDERDFSGQESTSVASASTTQETAASSATKSYSSRKRNIAKKEGVTKIGNNTYFYTGPKGKSAATSDDDDEGLLMIVEGGDDHGTIDMSAEEGDDDDSSVSTPPTSSKRKQSSARHNSKKSEPSTSTSSPTKQTQNSGRKRERKSTSVVSPAPAAPKRRKSSEERPNDSELPKFDPTKFKPGVPLPIIKKGDAEYQVIVTGVETGLCGKYWADMENLPPRRRSKNVLSGGDDLSSPQQTTSGTPKKSTSAKRKGKRKLQEEPQAERRSRSKKASRPRPPVDGSERSRTRKTDEESAAGSVTVVFSTLEKTKESGGEVLDRSSKRISANAASVAAEEIAAAVAESAYNTPQTSVQGSPTPSVNPVAPGPVVTTEVTEVNGSNPPGSSSNGPVPNASRSVKCLADADTQREVVVECFAPYDDHRWVNIGKERDGMNPDAVQYARALRPPYHLLSFLRIKGYSTKGMSCTDKNTMVFVVLEGEITVVLHTTQFVAKRGDSFYIPPKNYYNLINQKVREAELSLIQFQYDGPLPTVSAGSQSGNPVRS